MEISTFSHCDYRLLTTGICYKVNTGRVANLFSAIGYDDRVPRLCAKDTPVMRAGSILIPSLCVNSYPKYAWKSAVVHRLTRKTEPRFLPSLPTTNYSVISRFESRIAEFENVAILFH